MGVTVQNWFYSLPPALPLIVTWSDLTIIYLQQMEHLTNVSQRLVIFIFIISLYRTVVRIGLYLGPIDACPAIFADVAQ